MNVNIEIDAFQIYERLLIAVVVKRSRFEIDEFKTPRYAI